jgi:hypothetical protein
MILVNECGSTALIDQDQCLSGPAWSRGANASRVARVRHFPHRHDATNMIMGLLALRAQ